MGRSNWIGWAAILGLMVLASGCKKEAPANVAPGADGPAEADPASAEAQVAADLEDLNKLVRAYVQATKVVPKSVDELVTSGFVSQLPAPPPGKAFVIQPHPFGYQVILVDN